MTRLSGVLASPSGGGVVPGDVVHLVLGAHPAVFPSCLGAWAAGAVASQGDPRLGKEGIALEVLVTPLEMVLVSLCCDFTTNSLFWNHGGRRREAQGHNLQSRHL